MTTQPEHDVAISFLARDLTTATALHNRLSEGLNIFFYPRNQEELAGTNGMESMRAPFMGARLNAVLYQEPWGETPWTRIEQTAIQERCLNNGWASLFFITIGEPKQLPRWLPPQFIRFSLKDFPLEQAVGAIKARVKELGGAISPMTPAKAAAMHVAEAKYEKDRRDFFISPSSVHKAQNEVRSLFAAAERFCDEAKGDGADLAYGAVDRRFVVTNGHVSMSIDWEPMYGNVLTDSQLAIRFHDKRIALPGNAPLHYYGEPPRRANLAHYTPELARNRSFCWSFDGKQYTSEQVASDALMSFLDQATRALRQEKRRR